MNPLLLGPLFDLGKDLIGRLFPDKEKQAQQIAQAELALAQLAQEGRLKELGLQMSAIVAEAQSSDPWTSRARPTFLYVIYLMILLAVPMGVLSAFQPDMAARIATGLQSWLAAIPDSLWALFGAGYLGYSGARTWEKGKGVTK